MSKQVQRRRGKPNRGGGRFNRGRGQGHGGHKGHGGHGGGGGGGGSKHFDREFEDLIDGPVLQGMGSADRGNRKTVMKPTGQPSAHGRGGGRGGGQGHFGAGPGAKGGYSEGSASRREPKVKVPMQHIHMTPENQDMVRDMLKTLHGEDHNIPSDTEYDELDTRTDDHYWQTEAPLFVDSAHPYALSAPTVAARHLGNPRSEGKGASKPVFDINPVALQKLQRCGFSHQLCVEALQVCDGDVGSALEYLLTELRNLHYPCDSDPYEADIPEEITEMRQDEKLALESIYEEKFEERLVNRVWVIHLDLPELNKLINFEKRALPKQEEQEVCKFYRKGNCRFGNKCHKLHVTPEVQMMKKKTEQLQGSLADNLFALEVRFPEGNLYPLEAPLIAFSSLTDRVPPYTCLNISLFLMDLARQFPETQSAAVFSLISELENPDQLEKLLEMPPPLLPGNNPGENPGKPKLLRSDERPPSGSDKSSTSDGPGKGAQNRKETSSRQMAQDGSSDGRKSASSKSGSRKGSGTTSSESQRSAETLKQNRKLKEEFRKKESLPSYQKRMADRRKLPAWDKKDEVLAHVEENQVVVISGMTGCGKTTQVPQFILDQHLQSRDLHLCNIVCTQPRKISAIAVAQRVSDERAEKLGNSVGYQIRLESVQSSATRLLFCTTGIILRRLEGDHLLSDVTHIIVDEVHERSEDSDFLLMILRDILPQRPDLKVILMSATLNADLFSAYFGYCPVVDIPGRTFPVEPIFLENIIESTGYIIEERSPYGRSQQKPPDKGRELNMKQGRKKKGTLSYADAIEESLMGLSLGGWGSDDEPDDKKQDEHLNVKEMSARYPGLSKRTIKTMATMDLEKINYDLILSLLSWIVSDKHEYPKEGAILVFLPGFAEIQSLMDLLLRSPEFGHRHREKYNIIPLHSTLSSDEQNRVFSRPREGVTKIVIATNIAETSITIDDIVYVVDAGRMKEKRYDSSLNMESLETVWVSKANALQRRGRAGRVMSGVCFHLFTSHRFHNHLREQPIPVSGCSLLWQGVIRWVPKFGSGKDVLHSVVEPPDVEAMDKAMQRLQDVGALDDEENLTALGYHLGTLPVDVRIGKLMVFGAIFRCLDSALTLAASLSFKSPFVSPFGKKTEADEKRKEFAVGNSDYLTILNAYKQWQEVRQSHKAEEYNFCQENFLSIKTLQMLASLKQQYVELLSDIGFTKEGLRLRRIQRLAHSTGTDGIVEATGQEANLNTKNWKLVSAILVGALYPNVVQVMTPEKNYNKTAAGAVVRTAVSDKTRFVTKSDGDVNVHPSSVNFQVGYFESPYLVYHEKVKTSKVYIRDCTMVSVYSLLLFAGGDISIDLDKGSIIVSVDEGWIRCKASSSQVAELFKELRVEMEKLLEDKIQNPNMDLCTCPRGSRIINTIVELITTQ
ncbi:putative ATP-dependent RNA helicase DHX57 [Babylonia areolata]|uniref:putative ATP-dependent RNA helicase DHX57 n=1 Tax=Babylonia areolata TaxID=304850 RepID=UPI003FD3063C